MLKYDNESISERIVDLRNSIRAYQHELAEYLGLKRTTYRRREADGDFSWEHLVMLAELFNVSPIFLAFGIEDRELRSLAKMISTEPATAFHDVDFTIFDPNFEEKKGDIANYASFLCLHEAYQKIILDYIEENHLAD